ncbi:transcription initiation factor IIB family protein [Acidianus sulfidivorans JP7]|uniref:Transcription initiation factor IIB n=1 Tax=Acidianus sulfidivorans JP7 TaxID=619593 RepID=A0A2U9IP42_9CREN|nr:transcription initiation factor IIB family protein [Acidianus sulfidivorans]AWR97800.1 transcription initiation factor IIB family protein [Acidianus sulfidivorans JP7]
MICPNCKHESVIFDEERGEYICTNCGYVVEEDIVDQGPEWRAYNYQDRLERERTGSPLTLKVHDQGLSTKIGGGRVKDKVKAIKLQRLHDKIRVSSKDKKLVTYLSKLNSEAAKLELQEYVKETAAFILRKLVESGLSKRIDTYTLIAAVLYYSCEVNGVPKYLQEIRSKYAVSQSDFWNALKRIYKISMETPKPKIKPIEYIPKIVQRLGLPQTIATKSAEMVDLMYKNGLTSGKGYLALSAATVYLVSTLMDSKKTQKEIAEALNITEVTIRNRYKEIIKNFDIKVSL